MNNLQSPTLLDMLPLFGRVQSGEPAGLATESPERVIEPVGQAIEETDGPGEPSSPEPVDDGFESGGESQGLRQRRPISEARFAKYVNSRQFTQVETIAPGVAHGTYIEAGQVINVLLVHRSGGGRVAVSPGTADKAPVGQWAAEVGAVAAVNGNWFEPFDGPAVSDGSVYGGRDHGYTALFGFTADGDLVTDHHRLERGRVDNRVVEGVAGHPTLILDRVVTTDFGGDPTFTARHPRTAIGVTGSIDVVILVAVDGRSSTATGMTGLETARLLERLDAHHGVMLDGGGSTAMWISGRGLANSPSDPGRNVGNQIAVFGGGS